MIAADGIKSHYFLLVLSSPGAMVGAYPSGCHGEEVPTPAGTMLTACLSCTPAQCRVLSLQPALGTKGPWHRTHDPHHTTSSRNPRCPMSHPFCVPAWHPCCRHSLRFTPLIASYGCPMADCSYPRQTSPSRWHLRILPSPPVLWICSQQSWLQNPLGRRP